MDLKEFVETAIRQIIEGVAAAQKLAVTRDAAVAPPFRASGCTPDILGETVTGAQVLRVSFDVAVTVVEGAEGKAGAQVQVAGFFSAGAGGTQTERQERANRLQFVVPVALPQDPIVRADVSEGKRQQQEAVDRANRGASRGIT